MYFLSTLIKFINKKVLEYLLSTDLISAYAKSRMRLILIKLDFIKFWDLLYCGEVLKGANIWHSKSIFYVKYYRNEYKFNINF